MLVGCLSKSEYNKKNGVFWYRKLMIFTIYAFATPRELLSGGIWFLGLNKQKYFHLSVSWIDFNFLFVAESNNFFFDSILNPKKWKWNGRSKVKQFSSRWFFFRSCCCCVAEKERKISAHTNEITNERMFTRI